MEKATVPTAMVLLFLVHCLGGVQAAEGPEPAWRSKQPAERFLLPLDLQRIGGLPSDLRGDKIVLPNPIGPDRTIHVSKLRATRYDYHFLKLPDRRPGRTQLFCYELVGDAGYTWSFWSSSEYHGFLLHHVRDSGNFLAWSDTFNVYLSEVSYPVDRAVSLHENPIRSGRIHMLRVPDYISTRDADGYFNPLYQYGGVRVHSIEAAEQGGLLVVITDHEEKEFHTFRYDEGEWELCGEVASAKPRGDEAVRPLREVDGGVVFTLDAEKLFIPARPPSDHEEDTPVP